MFSSSIITHSCLTTRLQEAGCCTLPWSCLRPKHNIFRFQESVKGHRLVEFKIFFQLSSRPTESVLNARRKGQQVNRVALKMLFLEMTEFDVWSSPPPSFWIRKHLCEMGVQSPPSLKGQWERKRCGFFSAVIQRSKSECLISSGDSG